MCFQFSIIYVAFVCRWQKRLNSSIWDRCSTTSNSIQSTFISIRVYCQQTLALWHKAFNTHINYPIVWCSFWPGSEISVNISCSGHNSCSLWFVSFTEILVRRSHGVPSSFMFVLLIKRGGEKNQSFFLN